MQKALKYVTILDLIFILFIALSGFLRGVASSIVYYLAFVVPLILALSLKKGNGVEFLPPRIKISKENAGLTIPLAAPVIALVFLISWLTSLLLSALGATDTVAVSGNVASLIITHAVITSVLEEALFRYVPLAFIAPHSRKHAVVFSALFFAFAHCNLYQIPYAFAAGMIFAILDIAFDSIIPSLLLHFLNNLTSIFWIREAGNREFVIAYVIVLASLSALSLIAVFILRSRYAQKLSLAMSGGGGIKISYEPLLFFVTTFFIALISL